MKKQSLKSTILIFFFCLTTALTIAQQDREQMAFGGPTGIFINLGVEIASSQFPSGNVTAYKIDRKSKGQNEWQTISTVSAPDSYGQFLDNIHKSNLLLKDSIPSNELPLKVIWEKVEKTRRLDSLKYFGNPLVVRLALGVCYLDKDVISTTNYTYKISKLDRSGAEIITFISNQVSFPPKIEKFHFVGTSKESYSSSIKLSWGIPEGFNPVRFKVFRRSNFIGDFMEIYPLKYFPFNNDKVTLSIMDTLVEEGNTYQYYLTPIDYYQNPGTTSDTVTAAAINFNSIFPPYDMKVTSLDSVGALKLTWHQDQPNKILSLKIFRSTEYDKNFIDIAEVPGADSIYIDRTAEPLVKYFYYLEMNDPFGEVSVQSAKVFGLYKSSNIPLPPLNLRAEPANKGAKLVWEKPEEFVNVYHVYRTLDEELSLSLLSSIKSSDSLLEFSDTSATLRGNRLYSYAVRSENTSGQMSIFSDTILVVPKMQASLRAPLQIKAYEENSKVFLYWENLYKIDPSIEGYQVFRRIKQTGTSDEKEFESILDSLLSPKQNNYVDATVAEGNDYEYAVKAFDIYGNQSPFSSSVTVSIKYQPVLAPAGITAVSSNEGVIISWQPPIQSDIKEFKIFRYERGQDPQIIGSVKAGQPAEFLDTKSQQDNLYFYFVKSVSNRNYESDQSEEVGIRR